MVRRIKPKRLWIGIGIPILVIAHVTLLYFLACSIERSKLVGTWESRTDGYGPIEFDGDGTYISYEYNTIIKGSWRVHRNILYLTPKTREHILEFADIPGTMALAFWPLGIQELGWGEQAYRYSLGWDDEFLDIVDGEEIISYCNY